MIDDTPEDTPDVEDMSAADRTALVRAKFEEAEALDAEAAASADLGESARLSALAGQARTIAEIHEKLLTLEGAAAEET